MDAPTMNTPAVGAEPRVEEKGREAIVSVDAGSRVRMAEKTTDHAEAPFQHPHTWSSKRKWLIVTAISCVSFVV